MIERKIDDALRTIKEDSYFVTDISTKTKYTYAECFRLAKMVSYKLTKLHSEKIVVILENSYWLFVMYFSCMFSNITIIPIDPQKSEQEIQEILRGHENVPVICDCKKGKCSSNAYEIEDLFQDDQVVECDFSSLWNQVDFEKDYMITYTSGSSGKAKGVRHSLKNLFWSAISFGEKMNYGERSIVCHTMPMTYMAGILNTILMPFIMHSQIVIFPRFSVMSSIHFWKNVIQYHVNTFWLSPTMLRVLLTIDKKGIAKEYLSHCSPVFNIGTAPLHPELKEAFEQTYQVVLYQSYGLSETLFLTSCPLNSKCQDSSVGERLKEVQFQFAEDGEILISVPWMFKGYYDKSEETYFSGDYYISGDLGEMIEEDLFITGRKKDLIVRGGMNISPVKIEKELYRFGNIEECCVTGVEINGEERTVCWYISKGIPDLDQERQMNTCIIKKLGMNYKIDYFRKVNSIFKNLNGKADKHKMRKAFLDTFKKEES